MAGIGAGEKLVFEMAGDELALYWTDSFAEAAGFAKCLVYKSFISVLFKNRKEIR